jgi:hypothetical protein
MMMYTVAPKPSEGTETVRHTHLKGVFPMVTKSKTAGPKKTGRVKVGELKLKRDHQGFDRQRTEKG